MQTKITNINELPSGFSETIDVDIRGLDDKRSTIYISGMTSGDSLTLSNYISTLTTTITQNQGSYSADTFVELYIRSDNYPSILNLSGITTIPMSSYSIPQQNIINDFILMIKTI